MKLYLVTADTYADRYGVEISCLGIATNEESLEKLVHDFRVKYTFAPKVTEIESDTYDEKYLGGYIE